ncbi:MAG: DUF58 domain-containing protein [Actinobacteria bacterium]|nr:DUF58 domain-containing protein [Actinomycetota bacterium]
MSPSPRAALLLAATAFSTLVLPPPLAIAAAAALAVATYIDARSVRAAPDVERKVPQVLSRGVASRFEVAVAAADARTSLVVQAATPDLVVEPRRASGSFEGTIRPRRRGRHTLPALAERSEGPLGIGRWHHAVTEPTDVLVYPDLPSARRIALAVKQGRFRESGRIQRGPLGLGTDFESIRDYLPDDDIRQVNWRASSRVGRPMSNTYRVEQDRDVICVVDAGRLMAAPIEDHTRLDVALDAVAAVAAVANVVGDRCGAVAFDATILREVPPHRAAGDDVVRALFDLEPSGIDSDYELAFRSVSGGKRSLVFVFTDLLEDAAARPLVEAVPVIARRHAVMVATAADPDLDAVVSSSPANERDVYAMSVALDVLNARRRVAAQLRHAGAEVVEAQPGHLGSACVGAYLRAKSRARL